MKECTLTYTVGHTSNGKYNTLMNNTCNPSLTYSHTHTHTFILTNAFINSLFTYTSIHVIYNWVSLQEEFVNFYLYTLAYDDSISKESTKNETQSELKCSFAQYANAGTILFVNFADVIFQ